MAKTLVTIGYHNGELEWGRLVRSGYETRNLKGSRDITFHEVKDSDVETGDRSEKVGSEIERKIEEEKFELWIDIHCGFAADKHGEILLSYSGINDNIISKAKTLEGVKVNDIKKIPSSERPRYLNALADMFLSKEDLKEKNEVYQKGLERTLKFINEIYDIH